MSSRVPPGRSLPVHWLAFPAAPPAFPTNQETCEACPSCPPVNEIKPATLRPAFFALGFAPELALNPVPVSARFPADPLRSEEHTSELQSLMRTPYAVFCLKKKNKNNN